MLKINLKKLGSAIDSFWEWVYTYFFLKFMPLFNNFLIPLLSMKIQRDLLPKDSYFTVYSLLDTIYCTQSFNEWPLLIMSVLLIPTLLAWYSPNLKSKWAAYLSGILGLPASVYLMAEFISRYGSDDLFGARGWATYIHDEKLAICLMFSFCTFILVPLTAWLSKREKKHTKQVH